MSDIVERFRNAVRHEDGGPGVCRILIAEAVEAADTITRLTREVESYKAGNKDLQAHFDVLKSDYDTLRDENEKMRAALDSIAENEDQFSMVWAAEVARAARTDAPAAPTQEKQNG